MHERDTTARSKQQAIETSERRESAMALIIGGSFAFSIGAAFMKSSQGLTRMLPTMMVVLWFLIGAGLLTKAVTAESTSFAIMVSLGLEALITILIGAFLLGDHISARQALGMAVVVAGVALVRL
jgi:small multidrug resistance pump